MAHRKPIAVEPAFSLPMLVMTPVDVKRLLREVTVLNDYMQQQSLRTPGRPMKKLPRTSRLLEETAAVNKLNLLDAAARSSLVVSLNEVTRIAPVIQISFAVDPSSAFLIKIVAWFRLNIHPFALLKVGLQPNIAAGCTVRTTNRYFDLSLRKTLERQRHVLHDMLMDTTAAPEAPADVDSAALAGVSASGGEA